ncbi:hypothetical protein [Micromonospora sp. MS34]|uniref:hypothetical protein n=1 Tax=Micromonospora sp. MS34 TaxID=3385971 RepID=UPI0039A0F318
MTTRPRTQNFWRTVPGMLTAVAAVITAVGGLLTVLLQLGVIGGTGDPAASSTPSHPAAVPQVATTARAAAGKPWSEVQARWTANDGTVTTMRAETVRFCISAGAGVNLDESQDIAFEKMSMIEVLHSDVALSPGGKATLRVTLTNGATREGKITSGCDFFGFAEIGRYSLYPDKLLKIEFLR